MESSTELAEGSVRRRELLLIDGFNLLHAVILKGRDRAKWWRAENQRRVIELVQDYVGNAECWLVFDAARARSERVLLPETDGSGVEPLVLYAPSADDLIVELVERYSARERTVVSADRALQDRCRRFGTQRMSPWNFRERCGEGTSG